MDERKQPPVALMMLPLLGLAGLAAYQYFVPPEPPAPQQQPAAAAAQDAAPAQAAAVMRRWLGDAGRYGKV